MLNIYYNNSTNGPGKVSKNLIMGLNKLSIEYQSNNPNPKPEDKVVSLHRTSILNTPHIKGAYIGPNICVLPIDDAVVMGGQYEKAIVPSEWVKQLYMRWLPEDKIVVWPVGIDTELFSDKKEIDKTNDCLIYFKRRDQKELKSVIDLLVKNNQTFEVIEYGSYHESHFIDVISKSKYGIVLDNTESQGVAIEEMMSCNLPLLVWDVTHWVDRGEQHKVEATSIPYWDDRCGVKFNSWDELEDSFNTLISNLNSYNPRDFIKETLSLDICTKNLLDLIGND